MGTTLLTDGSSDTVLMPVLRWLWGQLTSEPIVLSWADLRLLRRPPRPLRERIQRALEMYPCELLFVHRDAERQPSERRYDEVRRANQTHTPHVAIVPVRMQEAWLLHDEAALRRAAGRPSGRDPLRLPPLAGVEGVPSPKDVLHEALRVASGTRGRRAKKFNPGLAAHRLADLISDWSPLRQLEAFRRLEADIRQALLGLGRMVRP